MLSRQADRPPRLIVVDGLPGTGVTHFASMLAEVAVANCQRVVSHTAPPDFSLEAFLSQIMLDSVDDALNIFIGYHVRGAALSGRGFGSASEIIEAIEQLLDSMSAVKLFLTHDVKVLRLQDEAATFKPSKWKRTYTRWNRLCASANGYVAIDALDRSGLHDAAERAVTEALKT